MKTRTDANEDDTTKWGYLTKRETEIAFLLASGNTNREIGQQLEISIKTVDTHRSHILYKLGLRSNVDLCRFMIRTGRVMP